MSFGLQCAMALGILVSGSAGTAVSVSTKDIVGNAVSGLCVLGGIIWLSYLIDYAVHV